MKGSKFKDDWLTFEMGLDCSTLSYRQVGFPQSLEEQVVGLSTPLQI